MVGKIREILQTKGPDVWHVGPKATAYEALEVMAARNVGALAVLDGDTLVGIFSERDYARKVMLQGKSSRDTMVKELMTRDVYTVSPDDKINDCMAVMSEAHVRHMPVMENRRLVGIVSIGDIVKVLIREQDVKIKDLETFISGGYYGSKG